MLSLKLPHSVFSCGDSEAVKPEVAGGTGAAELRVDSEVTLGLKEERTSPSRMFDRGLPAEPSALRR